MTRRRHAWRIRCLEILGLCAATLVLVEYLRTAIALAALMALTAVVLRGYRTPHPFAPLWAILRGALQLAAISLILAGVITDARWVSVALLVMFGVASFTATHRIGWSWPHLALVSASMALGVAVTLAIVFGAGAVEFSPRYALALGGIIIGNTMSIATLAGRRLNESVRDHWEEVEGWLALGATPRQSTLELARGAVYSALIPSTDQTKTTGLVTLPGAFVGAIFGGLSPLEAGRFQLVVLGAVMATGAITAVMVTAILAPVARKPEALG